MPLFGNTFSPKKTPPRKAASLSNLHLVSRRLGSRGAMGWLGSASPQTPPQTASPDGFKPREVSAFASNGTLNATGCKE